MEPICPRCRTATLQPEKDDRFTNAWVMPLRCSSCRGLWMEGTHVRAASRMPRWKVPANTAPRTAERALGSCPYRHAALERSRVELSRGPLCAERCPACRGVWFQEGDWELLASTRHLADLENLWSPAYQRRLRAAQDRRNQLRRMEATLGPDMFRQVMSVAQQLRNRPERFEAMAFLQEELRKGADEASVEALVTGAIPVPAELLNGRGAAA